jgi:hypothetical protein
MYRLAIPHRLRQSPPDGWPSQVLVSPPPTKTSPSFRHVLATPPAAVRHAGAETKRKKEKTHPDWGPPAGMHSARHVDRPKKNPVQPVITTLFPGPNEYPCLLHASTGEALASGPYHGPSADVYLRLLFTNRQAIHELAGLAGWLTSKNHIPRGPCPPVRLAQSGYIDNGSAYVYGSPRPTWRPPSRLRGEGHWVGRRSLTPGRHGQPQNPPAESPMHVRALSSESTIVCN